MIEQIARVQSKGVWEGICCASTEISMSILLPYVGVFHSIGPYPHSALQQKRKIYENKTYFLLVCLLYINFADKSLNLKNSVRNLQF